MRNPTGGFTVVEALLAVVVLVVGVLAIVGSSALTTRMIGRGFHDTAAAQAISSRLEWLRQLARSTSPPCTDLRLAGGSVDTGKVTEAWSVAATGATRRVGVAIRYPVSRGVAGDTLFTMLVCR